MFESIVNSISIFKPYLPQLSLILLVWITYFYTLRCGFVSDDLAGIADYDGKLQGLEYGMISRWVRFHICGGNYPSKHKFPDGRPIPCGKVSSRHHALSLIIFSLTVISLYQVLLTLVGSKIALLTCILFIVHPVCTQGVAWISGLGYPLSLFWITLSLNLTIWYYSLLAPSIYISVFTVLAFIIIQVLAINALFIALMSWVIFAFLGHYPFAILAFLLSLVEGMKIVKATIKLRKDEFKKQSMDKSTYLKPRKLIVAAKTFLYYIRHSLWPSRMGLYHEWGYHYDHSVEREDRWFLLGLLVIPVLVAWFFLTPILAIKLGLIWFAAFIFIFLNWITIQQFVTERYVMAPVIGVCLILSYYLQNHLWAYTLIVGLAIMRTWMHLPTYDNELRFYYSNTWNFPKSEVALGNLGVTYIRIGRLGSALDAWHESIQVNPQYDVPYYNIYSHHKSNAMFQIQHGNFQVGLDFLKQAYAYLEKCVKCEVCHFRTEWTKELNDIKSWLDNPVMIVVNEKNRQLEIKKSLEERLKAPKDKADLDGIVSSINDINKALDNISKVLPPDAPPQA